MTKRILRKMGLYFYKRKNKVIDPQKCSWCNEKFFLSYEYCPGCGRRALDALHNPPPKYTSLEKFFYVLVWFSGMLLIGYALWIGVGEVDKLKENFQSGRYFLMFPLILVGSILVTRANIFLEKSSLKNN